MIKFRLYGEAIFFAEDIDDAFLKLSEHFRALCEGRDSQLFESGTDIHLVKKEQ